MFDLRCFEMKIVSADSWPLQSVSLRISEARTEPQVAIFAREAALGKKLQDD
jgi:hypothetical protein